VLQTSFYATVALVLATLAWEAVLSLAGKPDAVVLIALDDRLGWRFRPDLKVKHRSFNPRGFPDTDHRVTKTGHSLRILLLGDSQCVGFEHLPPKTISGRLQNELRQSPTLEIMNGCVLAWGTDQELIYLNDEGIHYRPDYIFTLISETDVRDTFSKKFVRFESDGAFKIAGAPEVSLSDRLLWTLAQKSRVFQMGQRLANTHYGTFTHLFQIFPVSVPMEDGNMLGDIELYRRKKFPTVASAERLFTETLREINRLARGGGAKLVLVLLPSQPAYSISPGDAEFDSSQFGRLVHDLGKKEGIAFINAHDLGKSPNASRLFLTPADPHLSAEGNALVAKAIGDWLKQTGGERLTAAPPGMKLVRTN